MEDMLSFVSEADFFMKIDKQLNFYQKGWKESLSMKDGPSVGLEIIVKIKTEWAISKNRTMRTMMNPMIKTGEDCNEKLINKKNKDSILYEWK